MMPANKQGAEPKFGVHMGLKIWLDNALVDEEQAMVSVFDHGLLYGDGVFEGIRVYGGKIFEFACASETLVRIRKGNTTDNTYGSAGIN